jgi:HAD superfamily hydrolase (TIGR01484 family)
MFRPENNFQLGVFDINGTLCTGKDGLTDTIKNGFKNLRAQSIQTTVVTGRGTGGAKALLGDDWDKIVSPGMPIGVENGARLVAEDGSNLRFHRIKKTTLDAVIDATLLADGAVDYLAYTPQEPGAKDVLWLPKGKSPKEYLLANGRHVEIMDESVTRFAARVGCDKACMLRVGTQSPEVNGLFEGMNFFLNQTELNVLPDGVNKATGVTDIAEYAGVALSRVLVAGNDYNDLPMLDLPVARKIFIPDTPELRPSSADVISLASPQELGAYLWGVGA